MVALEKIFFYRINLSTVVSDVKPQEPKDIMDPKL